jgi:hypothetical protein
MPRYYLNLRRGDDDLPNDPDPMDFPDLEAARDEAVKSIREMASEALFSNRPLNLDRIEVADESGVVLLSVSPSEVLDASEC